MDERGSISRTMNETPYLIQLKGVHVSYPLPKGGGVKQVLNGVEFRVRPGQFVTVVGPTGCGKSTMLRLVLGAEPPTEGEVLFEGQPVRGLDRARGIVFQRYSLSPFRTVEENIAIGPELAYTGLTQRILSTPASRRVRKQALAEARELIARIGLAPSDASKYPYQLSGGMRQRVAIAQAIIMRHKVLLMDEPFGALDPIVRESMQLLILEKWKEHRMTVFFVTHDLEEAVFLGTRIVCLSQYYTAEEPDHGEGAKIVLDKKTPGDHPKPTAYKNTPEFNALQEEIRADGFEPSRKQRVAEFDLSHEDALRPTPRSTTNQEARP